MTALITILALLFVSLFIIVIVTEKYGSRDTEKTAKLSRYIMPLVALLLVAQLIKMAFFAD